MMKKFKRFHPLFVEGMSSYDPRDPEPVVVEVVRVLREHWKTRPPSKPVVLMIQGDPRTERGIAAITPRVAKVMEKLSFSLFHLMRMRLACSLIHLPLGPQVNCMKLMTWEMFAFRSMKIETAPQRQPSEFPRVCIHRTMVKSDLSFRIPFSC